jgi:hypothetical protein
MGSFARDGKGLHIDAALLQFLHSFLGLYMGAINRDY